MNTQHRVDMQCPTCIYGLSVRVVRLLLGQIIKTAEVT